MILCSEIQDLAVLHARLLQDAILLESVQQQGKKLHVNKPLEKSLLENLQPDTAIIAQIAPTGTPPFGATKKSVPAGTTATCGKSESAIGDK
ncbi:hypothetical protein BIV60_27210 [Bacillus sp. MUM 116]|nr:hypothetical protein BIV60_27210 [Bacillus sp. MUM 116]